MFLHDNFGVGKCATDLHAVLRIRDQMLFVTGKRDGKNPDPASTSSRHFVGSSVADPGSGAFLTPGSGIRNRFFPDPGSQIHNFRVKSSKIL